MLNIKNHEQEIELLIQRYYEMRWKRICLWREARTSFRLKYFTTQLVSQDDRWWEEFSNFENQNPFRIESIQVDGQEAEVVVIHPDMNGARMGRVCYLRHTEQGWRIARNRVWCGNLPVKSRKFAQR